MKIAVITIVCFVIISGAVAFFLLRRGSLRNEFDGISDAWKAKLENEQHVQHIEWTSEEPELLDELGPILMLKQLRFLSKSIPDDDEDGSASASAEGIGYSIATMNPDETWSPTAILVMQEERHKAVAELANSFTRARE